MASRPDALRPTRVTDLRKWIKEGKTVKPSVTTVMDMWAKPGLVNWLINQPLHQAYALDRGSMSENQWIEEVKRLTEIEKDKAPNAGTEAHEAMQRGDETGTVPEGFEQLYANACEAVENWCGLRQWQCEVNFCAEHYAGQADRVSDGFIVDWKTKQFAEKFKPGAMLYRNHWMQLAAYRHGLRVPDAQCAIGFLCLETNEVEIAPVSEVQLQSGWRSFKRALAEFYETKLDMEIMV